jgi:hypothetical protein
MITSPLIPIDRRFRYSRTFREILNESFRCRFGAICVLRFLLGCSLPRMKAELREHQHLTFARSDNGCSEYRCLLSYCSAAVVGLYVVYCQLSKNSRNVSSNKLGHVPVITTASFRPEFSEIVRFTTLSTMTAGLDRTRSAELCFSSASALQPIRGSFRSTK